MLHDVTARIAAQCFTRYARFGAQRGAKGGLVKDRFFYAPERAAHQMMFAPQTVTGSAVRRSSRIVVTGTNHRFASLLLALLASPTETQVGYTRLTVVRSADWCCGYTEPGIIILTLTFDRFVL